jgi:hypothetical protein
MLRKEEQATRLRSRVSACGVLGLVIAAFLPAVTQEAGEKTFPAPDDAGKALYDDVRASDRGAVLTVLGASAANIISSGDEVEDKDAGDTFVKRYEQMHRWAKQTDGTMALFIGAENWPFPIPLKKDVSGQWYFDTKAGEQEILLRRIGKNEIAAIRVLGALVDGQNEYYNQTHDGDSTKQYAQKIISDAGKQNGLYWKVAGGQAESPIGPLVAFATGEGYGGEHDTPQPFHGYFYRTLTGRGPNAKGGTKSYIVNGKMTSGFAFVAYPAEYRVSGVMTFLVDQTGVIYEKDLGPQTAEAEKAMVAFNPDKTWVMSQIPDVATESADDQP